MLSACSNEKHPSLRPESGNFILALNLVQMPPFPQTVYIHPVHVHGRQPTRFRPNVSMTKSLARLQPKWNGNTHSPM